MADNTIDTLDIQISSSTEKAVRALTNLSNKLTEVNSALSGVNTNGLRSCVKELGKLKELDVGKMTSIANGIGKFSNSIKTMGGVDYKGSGLNAVINSINRLSQVDVSGFDSGKLGEIIHQLSNLSEIPDVSTSVNRFVNSMARLANSGEYIANVSAELPGLGSNLKLIAESFTSVGDISEPVNRFVQSIAQLASAGNKIGQTSSQLGTLAKEVLSFFDVMKTAPKISENTIRMTEALAQLANASGKVNSATNSVVSSFSRLSSVTSRLGSIGSRVSSMMGAASSALSEFGNTASKAGKKTGNLASQLTSLYAKFFTVTRGIKALWNSVESASDYVETLNYFNSAFEQVTDGLDVSKWEDAGANSAEEYVGSFEKRAKELTKKMTGFEVSDSGDLTRTKTASLGLDPNQTMNYQATYAQMASSMGATADTATKLSQALTEIGADLASVKNLDFNDVWKDMASGMTGMSRALDKYGINIRVANLQQELYNLGIDTTVSKLNQTDKAILRTITVLNSTKYAWGDLANTINQPANQLRLLQSNFSALSRTIGSLFIPIITKVLPYLNALVIAVQRVFSWVGKLFGINLSDYTASTGSAAIDMDDIADSTEDAASGLDSANNNTKKLKKTLSALPFDELNQLNDAKTTKTKSSSGSGGVNPHLPELDAALDKALSEYQAAWDKAFEEMNNKANDTADKIVAVFKKIRKAAKPTTDSIKKLYSEGLSKLGNFSITALKDLWNNYLKPMGNWMLSDNSGLPRFFTITNDLLNKINWSKLNSSLSSFFTMLQKPTQFVWTGLMDFYEKFLVPVGAWTMNSAIPELVDALTNFGNNIHWDELNSALKNFWDALAPFAQNVGQGIVDFFKDLLDVGENFINTTVPGGLNSIADAIKNISPETAQAIGRGLGQISVAILGFKGLTFIGGIIGKDSPLGKGLGLLSKHPYVAMALGLARVVTALDNFGIIDVDWEWIWSSIDRIKEAIQNFVDKVDWTALEKALGNLWSAFQPFAEGFADALITGLEGIINIGADLINGIANAINWLAEKLSGVDPEFIKRVGSALGTLFAIKIAKDIVSKIFSFASGIGSIATKLLNFPAETASNLPDLIGKIGSSAEKSSGGFDSLAKALGPLVGEAGLIVAVGVAAAGATSELAGFVETMQGGNGIGTTFGNTMNNFIQTLQRRGDILSGSAEEIWQLKESLEQEGMTAEDKAKATQQLIDKLGEMGVTSDQAERAFSQLNQKGLITDDMFKILSDSIKTLDDKTTNMAGSIDLSKRSIDDLYETVLPQLQTQLGLSADEMVSLDTALMEAENSGGTAQDAFDNIMARAKELGINTESVAKIFAQVFPDAVTTMETNSKIAFNNTTEAAKSAMGGITTAVATASTAVSSKTKTGFGLANTAVSTAMAGMKKSTESTMPSIWSNIKSTNDDVETNSKTNWENSASAVSTALGTMDTDTKDVMGKVMTTIQSYWSSVLINTNQIWEKASGKVDTETGKMKTYTETNLSGISDKIKRLFNVNLTSIGRETAQSFADGMKQVHLPTLTYYISEWRKHDLGGGKTSSTPVYKPNWYAKGGLFNGAQVIGIGEAGSEAVLPLENPRTMKKIADSIVSSSDGSMGLTKEEMAKAVAQGVAMAMSMNSGNKNPQYIMNSIILDGNEIAKAVTKAQNETNSRFNPSPAY
nr:MAG TPA: minor tail protein [Caudoviricetes sp.]